MPRNTSNGSDTERTAADRALADELGMDLGQGDTDTDELRSLVSELGDELSLPVSSALGLPVATIDALRERIDDIEDDVTQTRDVATTVVAAVENERRLDDVEAQQETTHHIAQRAIAKTQQLEADPDHQEGAEQFPEGREPSSSPLNFFTTCRQSEVKTIFVERANRQNTYRAISIAKRWPEFATKRTDGSGVFLTKADMTTALTAELGKEPHRQTVKRVWEKLIEICGDDIVEKTRHVGRGRSKTAILVMDIETVEGLLEQRYVGLDLLADSDRKATAGGVTPVVMESMA
jgi:hypothetical protein